MFNMYENEKGQQTRLLDYRFVYKIQVLFHWKESIYQ